MTPQTSQNISLRERLSHLHLSRPIEEIEKLAAEINQLKKEKNAIILGHNYMSPDVYYGVSDFTGDSLALAQFAVNTSASIIVMNGVHFMAETAKILNPEKKVLIADPEAGCSLADSISAADVDRLKEKYPGIPVVTYINCSAAVKAASDVICTSANAVKVVNSLDSDTVIMLPDAYLAANVQKQTAKKIIIWDGKCMVHELFSAQDVKMARLRFPDLKVVAHPECLPEVTSLADFTGSTTMMTDYIKNSQASQVLLLTECSMGANIRAEMPGVEFVSTCQLCPHMKKITLAKVRDALLFEQYEVTVDPDIMAQARQSLQRMLDIGR